MKLVMSVHIVEGEVDENSSHLGSER